MLSSSDNSDSTAVDKGNTNTISVNRFLLPSVKKAHQLNQNGEKEETTKMLTHRKGDRSAKRAKGIDEKKTSDSHDRINRCGHIRRRRLFRVPARPSHAADRPR